jgi:dTMP kinase
MRIDMPKRGLFITFEGPESCGKSTQARLLYAYLRKRGLPVVFLREPGGTPVSEKIRKILLSKKNSALTAAAELFLYMASRAQVVEEVIAPALRRKKIVLCDRFLDSTIVYQGYGLGIDIGLIRRMGAFATGGIAPDLTILLDAPLKASLAKIGSVKDRIELRSLAYHQRVKAGYFRLARRQPGRIKIVRLAQDKAQTQAVIRGHLDRLLEKG